MTLPAPHVNPIYRRAGLAAVPTAPDDVSSWVVDETEKVVRGVVRRCVIRASRLAAVAAVALTLGFGAADAVGQTYASWSDFDVYGNAAGAGVWTIDVDIDVVNTINVGSGGLTQVKVFGSETFDPATIDLDTVCFGSATNAAGRSCDVVSVNASGPGALTIMLHFTSSETGILAGDTSAVLTGKTFDGMNIFGIDTIRTAPAGPLPMLRMAPTPEPTGSDAMLLSPAPTGDVVEGPELLTPSEDADGAKVEPTPDAMPSEEASEETPEEPSKETSEEPPPLPSAADAIEDEPPATEPAPALDEEAVFAEEPAPVPDEEPSPAEPVEPAKPASDPVAVPELVGLTLRAATGAVLETAGADEAEVAAAIDSVTTTADALAVLERLCADLLCAGVRFEERESADTEPGTVLQQSSAAGSGWTAADGLVVTVATAPPAPAPPAPAPSAQAEPTEPAEMIEPAGTSDPTEPTPVAVEATLASEEAQP